MKSISRRLVEHLVVGTLGLYAAWAAGFFFYTWLAFTQQFDEALQGKAQTLVELTELDRRGQRRTPIRTEFELDFQDVLFPEFQPSDTAMFYEVWAPDGSSLARSASLLETHLPRLPRATDRAIFYDLTLPDGRAGRAVTFRFIPRLDQDLIRVDFQPKADAHELLLALARPRETLNQTRALLIRGFLLFGFLLPLGTLWVVRRSVRRGLTPLSRMAGDLGRIDAGSLGTRFPTDSVPQELRPIVARLNDLLQRLDGTFRRERRLTADIAHELRTPIAELRLLAEMRLAAGDATGGDFGDVLEIAKQMEQRVETLLTLARCDANAVPVSRQDVDVAAAIQEAWQAHEEAARTRGLLTTFHLPETAIVKSDPGLLSAILTNLMANAVIHTPPGGAFVCHVNRNANRLTLRLTNTDDQLEPADLDRLAEPFWQKDRSRSDAGHAGLGLSLVQSYANLLSLDLDFSLPERGWFAVRLTISA